MLDRFGRVCVAAEAARLASPEMQVMNYLNEIAERFPSAVSLAAGRPRDDYPSLSVISDYIQRFVEYRASSKQLSISESSLSLYQYASSKGIMNDLLAELLRVDESVSIDPENVIVTNGCQEAMGIVLTALYPNPASGALLVPDLCYVGITCLCRIFGITAIPFQSDDDGPVVASVADAWELAQRRGLNPRCVYFVPDNDNPTGISTSCERRKELLSFCESRDVIVLEDAAYRYIEFRPNPVDSLLRLDRQGAVVHLGTFSKILWPGLRVGFMAVNDPASHLMDLFYTTKSFISVMTNGISQAIVGGAILEHEFTFTGRAKHLSREYLRGRDALLRSLEMYLGDVHGCHWTKPDGGLFVYLQLPMPFGPEEAEECAERYQVLVMPMSFFSLTNTTAHSSAVRLSYSNSPPDQIEGAIFRLSTFVRERLSASSQ